MFNSTTYWTKYSFYLPVYELGCSTLFCSIWSNIFCKSPVNAERLWHSPTPEPVFVNLLGAQELIPSLAGRFDNPICHTGLPGWRNRFRLLKRLQIRVQASVQCSSHLDLRSPSLVEGLIFIVHPFKSAALWVSPHKNNYIPQHLQNWYINSDKTVTAKHTVPYSRKRVSMVGHSHGALCSRDYLYILNNPDAVTQSIIKFWAF